MNTILNTVVIVVALLVSAACAMVPAVAGACTVDNRTPYEVRVDAGHTRGIRVASRTVTNVPSGRVAVTVAPPTGPASALITSCSHGQHIVIRVDDRGRVVFE